MGVEFFSKTFGNSFMFLSAEPETPQDFGWGNVTENSKSYYSREASVESPPRRLSPRLIRKHSSIHSVFFELLKGYIKNKTQLLSQ